MTDVKLNFRKNIIFPKYANMKIIAFEKMAYSDALGLLYT